ncbi:hypothetical protein [Chromobacterium alticapitis]|uniref:Chitinase n=1 Tax=Chromobacterium alticapitis TaxID=2073169 RepID=A0A2S5DCG1_9NEIS|nr:hypothetical protein [Chromobacterium alticapitis]POZ60701.1 hypothetical protein C2I19_17585 [Chromobacterium alticapitis]
MAALEFDVEVWSGSNENYGSLIASHFSGEDGDNVVVNEYVYFSFLSPAVVGLDNIQPGFDPWVSLTPESSVMSTLQDDGNYLIHAKLYLEKPHTLQPDAQDTVTFNINGNLIDNPELYADSFVGYVDEDDGGTVAVDCAASPDERLAAIQPAVSFGGMLKTVAYDSLTEIDLAPTTYEVTAEPVSDPFHIVTAEVLLSTDEISVTTGEVTPLQITFGAPSYQAALRIRIAALTGLERETLHLRVTHGSQTIAQFEAMPGETRLINAPAQGSAELHVEPLALNNIRYAFATKRIELRADLIEVELRDADLIQAPVDTTGFVTLPITVAADAVLSKDLTLRLIGNQMAYSQPIPASAGTHAFPLPVKPGSYEVVAGDLLAIGVLYRVQAPDAISVPASNPPPLPLQVSRITSLRVPGFPDFVSFGACTALTDDVQYMTEARASHIFTYAGIDGAGDAGTFLEDDAKTQLLIERARLIEEAVGGGHVTLPVVVSYTCNLSGGDIENLNDAGRHMHSYANYVLALSIAHANVDAAHPVGAAFVLNADFLGACQQHDIAPSYGMPVREPLQAAIEHCVRKGWIDALTIPADIENTIRGYVRSVNWLTHAVAENLGHPDAVSFGWVTNLWSEGSSLWVYDSEQDPAGPAQSMAEYARACGVFDAEYPVTFHAIDRYERDDLSQDAYVSFYCYGPREWERYFDFCREFCYAAKHPIMPWQISAAHLPTTSDIVNQGFGASQHWGTGGSYIFGHPEIGSSASHIHPVVLNFRFPAAIGPYSIVSELFERPFDLAPPKYGDFALRGIFAVQLGGGSTTGLGDIGDASPWARDKSAVYIENPVRFE